jgi:RHS repeat-associated protein
VLDYMHARYYDPELGRFLSVDPSNESVNLSRPQTWNRYSYAENNPVLKIDPDGAQTVAAFPSAGPLGPAAAALYHAQQMRTNPRYRHAAVDAWNTIQTVTTMTMAMVASQFAAQIRSSPLVDAFSEARRRQPPGVIIGESMGRVYQGAAQTGNLPLNLQWVSDPADASRQFVTGAMATGTRIFDVGYDPNRLDNPSAAYTEERRTLYEGGYKPQRHSYVFIDGQATTLWEWVRQPRR